MEQWNHGMAGNTIGFPLFHYSTIPVFPFLCSAASAVKFFIEKLGASG
jgi:hypothetical protein